MLFNVCNDKIFLRKTQIQLKSTKVERFGVLSVKNKSDVRRQELNKTIDGFSLFDDEFMSVVFDRNI